MRRRTVAYAIGGLALMVAPLAAQRGVRPRGRDVPPEQRPAERACGTAAECERARRSRPRDERRDDRDRDLENRRREARDLENRRREARDLENRRREARDRDRYRDDREWADRERDRRRWELDRERRRRLEIDSRRRRELGRRELDGCRDTYRDERCDGTLDGRGYPSQMPLMRSAQLHRMGVGTRDAEEWLGTGRYTAQIDERGDRATQVRWFANGNQLVQVWHDDDRDGRVDRVDIVQNGRVVRVIR